MADAVKTKPEVVVKDSGNSKTKKRTYTHDIGRRKGAVARVRLHPGKTEWNGVEIKPGEVYVNFKPLEEYFKSETGNKAYQEIFKTTNTGNKFSFTIKVSGGGKKGQHDAVLHGIARTMAEYDEKFIPLLRKKGYLTRDARVRQRRKVGMGGKSRRKKQSPKR